MLTKQPNDEINNPCEMLEKYSNDKRQERLKYCKEHLKTMVSLKTMVRTLLSVSGPAENFV